jgi:hypothetical protein
MECQQVLNSEYFSSAFREIFNKLGNCVVPIFEINGSQKNVFGSGLLVHAFGENFLLTSAHVVERLGNHNIQVYTGGNMYRLPEGVLLVQSAGKSMDSVDLAIFKLSGASVSSFANSYSYMEFDGLTNVVPHSEGFAYVILGYPCSRNKFRYSVKLEQFGGVFGEADDTVYSALKKRKESDFILGVEKRGTIDLFSDEKAPRTLPNLKGLSGGGVWMIGNFDKEGEGFRQPVPIGIVREIDYQRKALLITRVQYSLPALEDFARIAKENPDSGGNR